ncbi:MAG TPA: hypothetical protein VNZ49_12935 [Bacteroidia bacterium]|jgi:hypothetical protein|nr:hypothetical protein [Bacteroidia bacterium]
MKLLSRILNLFRSFSSKEKNNLIIDKMNSKEESIYNALKNIQFDDYGNPDSGYK